MISSRPEGSHPRVSQYRLTAHLGAAFICYTAMLWNRLSILRSNALLSHPTRGLAQLTQLSSPSPSIFRKFALSLILLVFTTALPGGLVAGLDAGLIYNEFPPWAQAYIPKIGALLPILQPKNRSIRFGLAKYARKPINSVAQLPFPHHHSLRLHLITLGIFPL
jgi:heme A synthase